MSQLPRHRGDRDADVPQAQSDPLNARFDHEFRAQSWSDSGPRIKVLATDVLPDLGKPWQFWTIARSWGRKTRKERLKVRRIFLMVGSHVKIVLFLLQFALRTGRAILHGL